MEGPFGEVRTFENCTNDKKHKTWPFF